LDSTDRASNGTDVTGQLSVPNTTSWQSYRDVVVSGISLSSGLKTIDLLIEADKGNFNYIDFTLTSVPTTTISTTVSAVEDDASSCVEDVTWDVVRTGSTTGCLYHGGFRFASLDVPQNAQITEAYLELYGNYKSFDTQPLLLKVYADDVDSSVNFTKLNVASRIKTTTSVDWTLSEQTYGIWKKSPNIASVVQEVVSRSGWTRGNSFSALVYDGDGLKDGVYWNVQSFVPGTTKSAKLTVTYK
jgi:hypothetical protein